MDMNVRLHFDWSRMAKLQIFIDHLLGVRFNSMHCGEMGSQNEGPCFCGDYILGDPVNKRHGEEAQQNVTR